MTSDKEEKMLLGIPEEMLARTAEMVCYFLTAIGGVLSWLLMPRG